MQIEIQVQNQIPFLQV